MASPILFNKSIRSDNISFFTGSGHGESQKFTGFSGIPLLEIGKYQPSDVQDKIIHLLSCNCALELGLDLVSNGCKAFFGYDAPFTFFEDTHQIFLECDTEIVIALLQSNTVQQAYERAIKKFDECRQSLNNQGLFDQAGTLLFVRNHLRSPVQNQLAAINWGDTQARLV